MGPSAVTPEPSPRLFDRLAERLEGQLKRAVPEAAAVLREAMPASANRAEDAAMVSINANFMSIVGDVGRGFPTADPRLPDDAVHWPRELAKYGSPQDCVIRGYLVGGEYFWRDVVLPEIVEISRDKPYRDDVFSLVQTSSQVLFDYIRDVAMRATEEYQAYGAEGPERARPIGASSILDLLLDTGDLDGAAALVESRLARFNPDLDDHAVLLRTALQWFDSLCCTVTTARRLGVHRNTLLYRLRKVEQFLGHSLQKDRLDVELAMRITERLKVARVATPAMMSAARQVPAPDHRR